MSRVPIFARGGGAKRKRGEIPDRPLRQGQVWVYLRDAFHKAYPWGHIIRIENAIGCGVPDVYYRLSNKRAGWIELKCGYDKCTDLQKAWHEEERAAEGMVWIICVRPNTVILDFGGDCPKDLGIVTWDSLVAYL